MAPQKASVVNKKGSLGSGLQWDLRYGPYMVIQIIVIFPDISKLQHLF